MRIRRIVRGGLLAAMAGVLCGPVQAVQRKAVIAHGWDTSAASTEDVYRNREKFAATGIDGIALPICAKRPDGTEVSGKNVMLGPVWSEGDFKETVSRLRACTSCEGLKESLGLMLWTPRVRLDWKDDAAWETFAANLAVFARIAREGGLKGVTIDHEDYSGSRQFQIQAEDGDPLETAKRARRRGRQIFKAFFAEFPDARVLSFWMFSDSTSRKTITSRNPPAADVALGNLWSSFLNGMIDVMPAEARMIDGCETCGYLAEADKEDFRRYAWDMIRGSERLVASENRTKYRSVLSVSFGQYLDKYINPESSRYYFGPHHGSRLAHLAENLSGALQIADDCIWLYGEKGTFIDWDRKHHKDLAFPTWESQLPGLGRILSVAAGKRDPALATTKDLIDNPGCDGKGGKEIPAPFSKWTEEKNPPADLFLHDATQGASKPGCLKLSGSGCFVVLAKGLESGDIVNVSVRTKGGRPIVNVGWTTDGSWRWELGCNYLTSGGSAAGWKELETSLIVPAGVNGVGLVLGGWVNGGEPVLFDDIHIRK